MKNKRAVVQLLWSRMFVEFIAILQTSDPVGVISKMEKKRIIKWVG